MKKVYFIACSFSLLLTSTTLFAQKECNLGLMVLTPAEGELFPSGDTAELSFSIENFGPEAITTDDTLYVSIEGFPNRVFVENIPVGDTIVRRYFSAFHEEIENDTLRGCVYLNHARASTYMDSVSSNDTSCYYFILEGTGSSAIDKVRNGDLELSLFPNPATDYLSIRLPANGTKNSSTLRIFSIDGRLVFERHIASDLKGAQIIDIRMLDSGFYMVTLSDGKQKFVAKLAVD